LYLLSVLNKLLPCSWHLRNMYDFLIFKMLSHIFGCVPIDGLWIGFIDHLYTSLETTSNYSAVAKLHNHRSLLLFLSLFPAFCVFSRCALVWLLTVEVLQLPALMSLLSGEYPEIELSVNCQLNYSAISSQPSLQSSTQLPTIN
jgi:hypothetical protein